MFVIFMFLLCMFFFSPCLCTLLSFISLTICSQCFRKKKFIECCTLRLFRIFILKGVIQMFLICHNVTQSIEKLFTTFFLIIVLQFNFFMMNDFTRNGLIINYSCHSTLFRLSSARRKCIMSFNNVFVSYAGQEPKKTI